jgi:Domain of unknown function (DUF4347)/Bacterial Ig domain/SMP-30/Gluconolactonase/LRE-like region
MPVDRRVQHLLAGLRRCKSRTPGRQLRVDTLDVRDVPSVSSSAANPAIRHEVVLVDQSVPDYSQLIARIQASASADQQIKIVMVGRNGAGLGAVDRAAMTWGPLDAIHVISHATAGQIELGGSVLDAETLPGFRDLLKRWAIDLRPGGDLLFYGCDLAASPAGQALMHKIASLTGADVAASTDLTGAASRGGDWVLEFATGRIDSRTLADPGWQHTLGPPAGVVVSSPIGMKTTEAGGTASFTVVLTSQPPADVTIPISSSDTTEGTVSTSSLTFTPTNWSMPQTVIVTGVDDFVDDGNINYTVVTSQTQSADPLYNHLAVADVTVTNQDDDTAGTTVTPTTGLITTEAGGQATFTVVLDSQPLNTVTIAISSSSLAEGTVSTSKLTFSPQNWNVVQTVTVAGVNDFVDDGDIAYTITMGNTSTTDPKYSNKAVLDVAVTNLDDDTAGFAVTPTSGLTTREAGGSATFSVALTSQPAASVTIPISSSNTAEGTVSVTSLTFTPQNWNVAQTVTVTGVNDFIDDGDIAFMVVLGKATSNDAQYKFLDPADVAVTNLDDDTVGINIWPSTAAAGPEFQVNTTVKDNQMTFAATPQAVAMNALGNYVVTWSGHQGSGTGWDIYAQRFSAAGDARGGEFRVNTTLAADQQYSTVAMDAAGNFVIVWASKDQDGSGWGIYARRYDNSGNALTGEFRVNTATAQDQLYPTVAMNATGSFVITWSSHDQAPNNWNVYARRYDAAGAAMGGAIPVNSTTNKDQEFSTVAMDAAGNFVVVWRSVNQDGSGQGLYGRRFDASGAAASGEFQINTTLLKNQQYGSVVMTAAGQFVVTWSSQDQDGNGWGVFAQCFEANGASAAGEFQVNTTAANDQQFSTVAVDRSGDFVVSWSSKNQDGAGSGIYAQRFRAGGAPLGNEFRVNTTTANDQQWSSVAMAANGNFVVVWSSNNQDTNGWGIFGQRYRGLETSEAGTAVTFQAVLNSQPTGNVTVTINNSDSTEGSVGPITLTFRPNTWNVPQTVTVTGVDDAIRDGDILYDIQASAASNDPLYAGLASASAWVINRDNDTAGIRTTPSLGLETTESGAKGQFSVVLENRPSANVTVTLASSNSGEGVPAPTSVTFTPANWNVAQTVIVTGVADHVVDGDQTFQITGIASSTDANYANLAMAPVTLVNVDMDAPAPGILVAADSFLVVTDNNVYRVNSTTGAVTATYNTGLANDGIAVAPNGNVYVADYYNTRIRYYSPSGALINDFSTNGKTPQGLTFGPDGQLYVTTTASSVERYDPDGSNHTTFIPAGSGGLNNAKAITWGPDGNAYVTSYFNSKVLRFDGSTGAFLNVFATGSGGFEDLAFGPDGNLYVASYGDGNVYRYRGSDGTALGAFVSGINTPYGLRFNLQGDLAVSSRSTGRILLYAGSTGTYLGNLNSGLNNPAYIVDTSSLVTRSNGGQASFQIVLRSPPSADVVFSLASSRPNQGNLSATTLTFTAANWNVPQTVTVTGLDDAIANGDQSYQINATVTSSDSDYASLTINPIPVLNREVVVANRPPIASDDSYVTNEDAPLTVPGPGVLGNDSDPDGDALQATLSTNPSHGFVTLAADGSFAYTPNANYFGTDSFVYKVSDGRGGVAIGTVHIVVNPVNDPPVAVDEHFTVGGVLGNLNVPAPGVLANDQDADGDTLQITVLSGTSNGTLTWNPDGSFTYTPALLFLNGTDSFIYQVNDGHGGTATATAFIDVSLLGNRAPTAVGDAYSTAEDTRLTVAIPGILGNDSDLDGDTLRPILDSNPLHGTLYPNADGSFVYIPTTDWSGIDNFTYHVNDGSVDSNVVTVQLTVTSVNDPPSVGDDVTSTPEDSVVTIAVLGNDTDVDGDGLTVLSAGPAGHGIVTMDALGVHYTPNADWNGSDTFQYTVADGHGGTSIGMVTVTVTPANDSPAATTDGFSTSQNTTLTIGAPGVLANDFDVDGDSLSASLIAGPTNGALIFRPDGSFNYQPNPDFRSTDSFTYRVSDPSGAFSTATVTIRVIPPNGKPVGLSDNYSVAEDTQLDVPASGVLANDTPPGNLPLTAQLISGPAHGQLTFRNDGSFIYTPGPNFQGTDSFRYRAVDVNGGGSGAIAVFITVSPAEDAPVGFDDRFTMPANSSLNLAAGGVLINDSDPDGDPLTVHLVVPPSSGQFTLNADGSFSYTPDPGFTGDVSFQYVVDDGTFTSGPVIATIHVELPVTPGPTGVPEQLPPANEPGGVIPVVPPVPIVLVDVPVTTSSGDDVPIEKIKDIVPIPASATLIATVPPQHYASLGDLGGIGPVAAAPGTLPKLLNQLPPTVAVPPLPPLPSIPSPPAAGSTVVNPSGPIVAPSPMISEPVLTPILPPANEEQLIRGLDELEHEAKVGSTGRAVAEVAVASGFAASVGYVLLNPRLALWLIGAFAARRAVWKPFDPLDVVLAWDKEDNQKDEDEDEKSLAPIFGK